MRTTPACTSLLLVLLAPAATAQVALPPSISLQNYDRVPIGETSSFEGGAFVARADDASANWYNPAGLGRAAGASLSANATLFESTSVTAEGFGATSHTGASVPAFLGSVVPMPFGGGKLYGGFSITQPQLWSQSIDTDLAVSRPVGTERVLYGIDTTFSRLVPGVALGYAPGGAWRFGVGASVSITSLRSTLNVSDRFLDTGEERSAMAGVRVKGSAIHARLTLGALYDASPDIRLGATLKTPGLSLSHSGSLAYESLETKPGYTQDILFRDDDALFDYKLPLELSLGAACKFGKAEVEVDLKAYDRVGSYPIFSSDKTVRTATTQDGGEPTVTTEPFGSIPNEVRRVLNVAIGARLPMKKGMLAHLGFFTDFSPSTPDSAFEKVNLYGLTLGGSRPGEHFSSSFGFTYVFGTSDPISVSEIAGGGNAMSKIRVRSIGFIYASSYRF